MKNKINQNVSLLLSNLILFVLVFDLYAAPSISELSSIHQIPLGQQITFDSQESNVGFGARKIQDIESRFNVRILGDPFLTGTRDDVVGNFDAPLSGAVLELRIPPRSPGPDIPTVVTIETTGEYWASVGASFGSSRSSTTPTLFLRVFGTSNQIIGEVSHQFYNPAPGTPLSQADYNKSIFFLGIQAGVSISSVQFESQGGIGVIDNLTFNAIPEPSSALLAVSIFALLASRRSRR